MDYSHLQPKVDNGDFCVLRATGARGIWIKLKAPDDVVNGGHGRYLDDQALDDKSHDVHNPYG